MRIRSLVKPAVMLAADVLSPFFSEKCSLDAEAARRILTDASPKPQGDCVAENTLLATPTHDLQIIVPAYNVEKYLKDCIDSILAQKTKYSYKIVLVDDGSTDSTPAIADSYNDERLTVIHQTNKGFSGARNTGLQTIFGKYIMFIDSDDFIPGG